MMAVLRLQCLNAINASPNFAFEKGKKCLFTSCCLVLTQSCSMSQIAEELIVSLSLAQGKQQWQQLRYALRMQLIYWRQKNTVDSVCEYR